MLEAKVSSRYILLGPVLAVLRLMDVLHQLRQKSHADPLQSLQSTSLYPRIVDLYKTEGLSSLFKGTGPRTGAVMVAGGIYLGLYDAAKMWVGVDR